MDDVYDGEGTMNRLLHALLVTGMSVVAYRCTHTHRHTHTLFFSLSLPFFIQLLDEFHSFNNN